MLVIIAALTAFVVIMLALDTTLLAFSICTTLPCLWFAISAALFTLAIETSVTSLHWVTIYTNLIGIALQEGLFIDTATLAVTRTIQKTSTSSAVFIRRKATYRSIILSWYRARYWIRISLLKLLQHQQLLFWTELLIFSIIHNFFLERRKNNLVLTKD